MVRRRSASVGSNPARVELNLNLPIVKSCGRGLRKRAAFPFPSPLAPWHPTQ